MKYLKKLYRIICGYCGDDIDAKGQDNMSPNDVPMCEDCARG